LQIHALFVQDATILPQREQRTLVVFQSGKLFLDFGGGVMLTLQQLLSGFSGQLEAILTSVDLALVLLVTFQKSLCSSHILSQLIGRDDGLHAIDPGHEVAEIGEETVQVVGLIKLLLALASLGGETLPVVGNLGLFVTDLVTVIGVNGAQPLGLGSQCGNLILQGGQIPLHSFVFALQRLNTGQIAAIIINSCRSMHCSYRMRRSSHSESSELLSFSRAASFSWISAAA